MIWGATAFEFYPLKLGCVKFNFSKFFFLKKKGGGAKVQNIFLKFGGL